MPLSPIRSDRLYCFALDDSSWRDWMTLLCSTI